MFCLAINQYLLGLTYSIRNIYINVSTLDENIKISLFWNSALSHQIGIDIVYAMEEWTSHCKIKSLILSIKNNVNYLKLYMDKRIT